MRNSRMTRLGGLASALILALGLMSSGWAGEGAPAREKYPNPHALHLSVMSQHTAEISVSELEDWPSLIRALQAGLEQAEVARLLGAEACLLVSGLRPGMVRDEAKRSVVNELNGLLLDKALSSRARNCAVSSPETIRREAAYKKTRSEEDLKWLNRSALSDIFPQIPRKTRRVESVKRLTCTSCHEMYKETDASASGRGPVGEREVMECFSLAIAGETTLAECVEKANQMKRSDIPEYGPLKNFVMRGNPEGTNPLLIAVRPSEPYTFKPLLKRFVCIECHGSDRKTNEIVTGTGKKRKIPLLYGAGSGEQTKEWAKEVLKQ